MSFFLQILLYQRTKERLNNPVLKETLFLSLSTSDTIVSIALEWKQDKQQMYVYFISRVLSGPKMNSPSIAKIVYALTIATRNLQSYFDAHCMKVLMD